MTTNPVSGGFIKIPAGVGEAHVLLSDNSWRLISALSATDELRTWAEGRTALLGDGALVPVEWVWHNARSEKAP